MKKPILIKKCLQCEQDFVKRPNISVKEWNFTKKFCSRKCDGLWRSINKRGRNSTVWKENVGYNAVHKWLYFNFGNANCCENRVSNVLNFNCSGESSIFEWSHINEKKLERNRESFRMLCKNCHKQYDHHLISNKHLGNRYALGYKHSIEALKKISLASIKRGSGFKKGMIPWNKKLAFN